MPHRAHADDVAGDRDFDRLFGALAHDLQSDLGVDRAAHLFDRLVEGHALHGFVVEMRDHVIGADAGLGGGRIVDRHHDLDEPILHRDLDAEAAELAARLHLHVAEALRVHVARMRVEPVEHAVDRRFDQLGVFRLLDIVRAHPLEYVAEQVELTISVGRRGFGDGARQHRRRLNGDHGGRGASQGPEEHQGSLTHHPRTFSLLFVAHRRGLEASQIPLSSDRPGSEKLEAPASSSTGAQ